MLADTILNPRLEDHEIEEALNTLELSFEDQMMNPASSSVLTDSILESCYGSQGLGKPSLLIKKDATREQLIQFLRKYYRPERCVISAVGVDHDEFVDLVQKHFDFGESNVDGQALTTYERLQRKQGEVVWHGGERRVHYTAPPTEVMRQNMPSLTAAVVAFEGVSIYDPDVFPIHVLETALGGGDSFSSGGPGKGILSIINHNFLGYYGFWNMIAQHNAFTDTGVFCVHASAEHELAERLVPGILNCVRKSSVMCKQLLERLNLLLTQTTVRSHVGFDQAGRFEASKGQIQIHITNKYGSQSGSLPKDCQ